MVKKVPLRKCLGCQERMPKRSLLRIVRSPQGEVLIDPTGKKPGRGAYICADNSCLEKVLKSKSLEKSLGAKFNQDILNRLQEYFKDE